MWWGRDYCFDIACVGALITGLLLFELLQVLLICYFVWWGRNYWFWYRVCSGSDYSFLLCVDGQ